MWRSTVAVFLFAWVLWMDETVYTFPTGPDDSTPFQLESAKGRWTQVAVTNTRGECEAMRMGRVRAAINAEAAASTAPDRGPRYREQFRYFCSPAVNDPGK